MLAVELGMMHRRLPGLVAILCVLVQLAVGVSSALGLVLCSGREHSAIESSSGACCAAHRGDPIAGSWLEDGCCSDTPLAALALPLADTWRAKPMPASGCTSAVAPVPPAPSHPRTRSLLDREASASARAGLRAVVLRI